MLAHDAPGHEAGRGDLARVVDPVRRRRREPEVPDLGPSPAIGLVREADGPAPRGAAGAGQVAEFVERGWREAEHARGEVDLAGRDVAGIEAGGHGRAVARRGRSDWRVGGARGEGGCE